MWGQGDIRPVVFKTSVITDFPGGSMFKDPPVNAGGRGSIPSLGRFHTPCAATAEVRALEPTGCTKKSQRTGALTSQLESSPDLS